MIERRRFLGLAVLLASWWPVRWPTPAPWRPVPTATPAPTATRATAATPTVTATPRAGQWSNAVTFLVTG